jgi:transposase
LKYNEWTKILGWPGYQVYQWDIDEERKTLKLWVRRKPGTRKRVCSGCGQHCGELHDAREREVRDLPWSEYQATVVVELHRVRCPECGPKIEKVAQLPSKAPYSQRFEEAVGQACESAAARQVARRISLAESTVRAIDLRWLERWEASRRKPALKQMGVDEIYRGKKDKFLTVVCNLETGEPLWFGQERKKEPLNEFFRSQLRSGQRRRIEAACVDMWEPFRLSIEEWAPQCQIVYDKFHILQHVNEASDEVRRAEFFRHGKQQRALIKGKKWLLMSRWKEPDWRTTGSVEPAVPTEPEDLQGLPAQRKLGQAVGLPLRGGHAQLSREMVGSTEVAAPGPLRETCGHAGEASARHPELLYDQGSLRGGGSR